jgi:simple sugar transport system substrate-binding protein
MSLFRDLEPLLVADVEPRLKEAAMTISRRTFSRLAFGAVGMALGSTADAAGLPAPFDKPASVKMALVRYLSSGDFFRSYLAGAKAQAEALGVELQVFDSRQDGERQAEMVDEAIALRVDGIIIQHGPTDLLKAAAQRAVHAGIKIVAFDIDLENDKIPQIEQSDRDLARLVLEQVIRDNGETFKAGYVYVAGIAPLDRRNETWKEFKARYPGIQEVTTFGTMNNPIANSVAALARPVLEAHPDITVMFAPYDEFARGVKLAVDGAKLSSRIKIYSADISTPDIVAMREPGSAWVATAATNPALVGRVSVRALAMLLAGQDPGRNLIVPPTLITQAQLRDVGIKDMESLGAKLPQFYRANVALPAWMPLPLDK